MEGHYDPLLTGLSVAISIFASYTALSLAGRMREAGKAGRFLWLLGAAVAMGGGTWSMHFVSMLALDAGHTVGYDVWRTLAMLLLSFLIFAPGLRVIGQPGPIRWLPLTVSAVIMGGGIVAMHYLGMVGMVMHGRIVYDPGAIVLSVVIATAAFFAVLYLTKRSDRLLQRGGGALILGAMLVGMHILGVGIAEVEADGAVAGTVSEAVMSPPAIAGAVVAATLLVLLLMLLSALAEQRMALLKVREDVRLAIIEERLAAERWLSDIADNLPGAIFRRVMHPDGCISHPYVSEGIQEILPFNQEDLRVPAPPIDLARRLFPEAAEQWLAAIWRSAEMLTPMRFEGRVVGRDGVARWLRTASNVRRAEDGSVIWDGVMLDVTERRRQEEVIVASLAEKEVLLREIHHRVKNNLQVVISLLSLEGHRFGDPKIRASLEAIRSRISVMGRIHEQLYGSGDFARINFGEHLDRLCQDLCDSQEAIGRVTLQIQAEPLICDLDTAIPLGLIANELITNSFKYAFPAGRGGRVDVMFHRLDDRVELSISDDGIGMPTDGGGREGGVGRQLVAALVQQLDAELVYGRKSGTCIAILLNGARFQDPVPAPAPSSVRRIIASSFRIERDVEHPEGKEPPGLTAG